MSRQAGVPPSLPVPAVVAILLLISCITLPAAAVPVSPSGPTVTLAVKIPVPAVTVITNATVPATPTFSPWVPVTAVTLLPVTDAGERGETAPGRDVTPRIPAGVTPLSDDGAGGTRHGVAGEAAEESREGQGASDPFTGGDTVGGPQVTVDAESRVSLTLTPVVTEEPRVSASGLFADGNEKQQVLLTLQQQDPSVRDIRGGGDAVIIEYGRQGTLLGLVPVPYTETVTIGPGGEYRAEVSWWAIFTFHEPPGSMRGEAYREQILDRIGKIRNGTAIGDLT